MGKRPRFSGDGDAAMLQNKLTVGDAKHIIRTEGGVLTARGIAIQVITVSAVAIFTARAILTGQATVWHLLLPMIAEYVVLLIALPPVSLILPDRELKKESRRGMVLLGILVAITAGWIAYQAHRSGRPWNEESAAQWDLFREWVVDAKMHWAILAAAGCRLGTIPSRIAAYRQHGPPFMAVGIGCGMRVGLFVLGAFFLPWLFASSVKIVWALWGLILLAEALALWMHLDIQWSLKKRGIAI